MSISYFNLFLSQRGTEKNKPLNLQCFLDLFSAVEELSRQNRNFSKILVKRLLATAYKTAAKRRRIKLRGHLRCCQCPFQWRSLNGHLLLTKCPLSLGRILRMAREENKLAEVKPLLIKGKDGYWEKQRQKHSHE